MTEGGLTNESSAGGEPSDASNPLPARRSRWRSPRRWLAATAAVAIVVGLALFSLNLNDRSRSKVDQQAVGAIVDKKVGKAIQDLQSAPSPGVGVYNTIGPPLVVIQSEHAGGGGEASGLGSGIIIDSRGEILTALHVVQDAVSIKVSFSDGTDSPATIRSSDPDHDIAVLTPENLPQVVVPAVLGSTGGLRIGDEAFAVGHPLGLVGSLTAGVISGLGRSFPLANGRTMTGLIQFDAAVNPGNSGGPLLNRKGQVIGIVTGLANPAGDGDFIGIGFAVPINTAGGAAGAPAQ